MSGRVEERGRSRKALHCENRGLWREALKLSSNQQTTKPSARLRAREKGLQVRRHVVKGKKGEGASGNSMDK